MKKLNYILVLFALLASCRNKDVSYPDYTYNAVYFPLQYPFRTLILGDSPSDNSLDKKLQFHIGVSIGGMYENKKSWDVNYVLDKSLVPSTLVDAAGVPIKVLPDNYYTLSPLNKVTIPAGSFNGLILVQLTDAFLDDPIAVTGNYVIPLRITGSTADSVLTGVPLVTNPDKLRSADWDANAQPRDFVLFGIKYINPYHGTYLHRGKDVTLDAGGNPASTATYHAQYVEQDQLWTLKTTGRTTLITSGIGSQLQSTKATAKMTLNVASDGKITVTTGTGSTITATGTGSYVKNAEVWGGQKHHAMYLDYTYKEGAVNHHVTDTLVFRDNGVVFEQIVPKVE
ncbi:DUF1735 domain-containing protein (plasmid) [Pedobacter sp. BS3]|uniref:DUF5627 domain-containing protein n=1 Tax=Pedobacter sp. BS3 TaxID=2567937 RepID=UPI0011ED38DF|nr:DUF5627 domain-containing protein [Pedobacter sp. BS3]TZF85512.1 DUF1735 domain-containing protein [Pedobacter sp. BS3]